MTPGREEGADRGASRMVDSVARKQARKLRARREGSSGWAEGLSYIGVIGWSITVPTLLGIALGVWLDGRRDDSFSWTLMLLAIGLVIGCANAWWWLKRETARD